MPGKRRDTIAFTVVVTVLVVLGAAGMLLVLALSGAPRTLALATVLATVPVVPLIVCYMWLDRYEPEPRRLLAAGLLWGGFVATAAAILLGIGGFVVGVDDDFSLAVGAPFTEEATKGAFLLLLLWWRRAELDGVLDGIVYAGMIGIGFAFVENILYLAAAYNGTDGTGPGGTTALTATFVVRCLFSPFAHPFFTTFTGIGVGIAVASRSRTRRFLAPLVGYLCAVAAHAIWNASTLFGGRNFILIYVVLMAPAFLGAVGFAVWARRSESRMLAASLERRCRPWLDPGDRHRLGRRPRCPSAEPPVRAGDGRRGGPRGDARLPAGGGRARVLAQPLPSRYAASRFRRARPRVRRPDRAGAPLHRVPRTGGSPTMSPRR